MNQSPAPYYNDLDASLAHAWALLQRGAHNRRSHFHTLTLANTDDQGYPDARILVLREADAATARLRFHTDARSDKAALIATGAAVSVLAYDPDEHIQLRLRGTATIDTSSAQRQAAWERTSLYGRRCYLGDVGPGGVANAPTSGLPANVEGIEPSAERTVPGLAHFALLWVTVTHIEWLFLAHQGHRRARFEANPTGWAGRWLIP
jgi:pyridoxamine 5'-phosphate oxidase